MKMMTNDKFNITPAHIRALGVAVGSVLAAIATLIVTVKGAWC